MGKITVIDSPCGAGKSTKMIEIMKANTLKRYVYITPFKKERDRVAKAVPDTYMPDNANRSNTKLEGMETLISRYDKNITSTHALFRKFSPAMADLVRTKHLTLILDEVMDVVEELGKDVFPEDDREILFNKYIAIDDKTGKVSWIGKDDYNGNFHDLYKLVTEGHVFALKNDDRSFVYFMWTFPIEVFKAFDEVIICTYMFKSQLQRYYYDMYNIPYEMKSIENGEIIPYKRQYIDTDLINLYEGRLNTVGNIEGNKDGALSLSWFKRKHKVSLNFLKTSMYDFICNEIKRVTGKRPKSSDIIWTTYKAYKNAISGKGYTKGFLECNSRATNEYRNRHIVMYCVNRFFNPYIKRFFAQMNVTITKEDEEAYALSEMIQFICRSAIRDGKKIYCFIPSERMRELLKSYHTNKYIQSHPF